MEINIGQNRSLYEGQASRYHGGWFTTCKTVLDQAPCVFDKNASLLGKSRGLTQMYLTKHYLEGTIVPETAGHLNHCFQMLLIGVCHSGQESVTHNSTNF